MLTKIIILFSLVAPTLSWGSEIEHRMSVKDRLRISLWTEGLGPKKHHLTRSTNPRLPEEIERSLRKL